MTGRPLHLRPKRVSSRDPPTMSTRSVSLYSEPSQPADRRRRGLSPKSYATAAVESSSPPNAHDSSSHSHDGNAENGNGDKSLQDAMTKRRKKKSSKSSDDQKSKSGSGGSVNGYTTRRSGDHGEVIMDRVSDKQGRHLTSVKPPPEYEDNLRLDQKEMKEIPRQAPMKQAKGPQSQTELVSGRTAGSGWERSGIRWAPLNVPLKRRLQTLAVLGHVLGIAIMLAFFLFLCAIPIFWPILFPYTLYVLFSSEGSSGSLSKRSEWLRSSRFWSLFASYFPARLHRSDELEPTRKYVFGYHPHGIIGHGAIAAFATEALGFGQLFPGITNTLLTLDSNFRIPFYRDYLLALGLRSVDRTSIENLLSKGGQNGEGMGRAVTIVVGGARESLDAVPGTMRLVLRRRKGFVKVAVKAGADLVPVLGFGENELYEQVDAAAHPWIHRTQMWVKRLAGWTIPLFHARGVFNYDVGLMPYRRPINIVVGRAIKVEQMRQPSEEYVNELHAQYMAELQRIWDDWHETFAKTVKSGLEIVE